ncbi:hypothetical protein COY62_02160 [bacterium (Candidatus Howlettbacteria) CG_4_10_14_0_8_um_filter_40_9]|nr:MAG: hypothetical protein COY62_02160 [bacterium (Candidatus Howlettbacteria) CG_4_10_14_0_8_um_filter_40_9]
MSPEAYKHLEEAHLALSELGLELGKSERSRKCCNAKNSVREAIIVERTGKSLSHFAARTTKLFS